MPPVPGTLEFRILANPRRNQAVIDQALKEPTKAEVLESSGKKLAWWVPIDGAQRTHILTADPSGIVHRTRSVDGHDVDEVLVMADPQNLTGEYLNHAEAATDRAGKPALQLKFCDLGGRLLAQLTGDHLPDRATNVRYELAFILDGKVYYAPSIATVISDRSEMTGSFTQQEVSDFADFERRGIARPASIGASRAGRRSSGR